MRGYRRNFDFRLRSSQFVLPPAPVSATYSVSASFLTVTFDSVLDGNPTSPSLFTVFNASPIPFQGITLTHNNFAGSPAVGQVNQNAFVQLPNPLFVTGGPFLRHVTYSPPPGVGLRGLNGAFVAPFSIGVNFVA